MSWKEKLMLRMMSNKVVIKIFSTPIVMKIMMGMTQVITSIMGWFQRKREVES